MAFKQKGSPFARNFGGGSPIKSSSPLKYEIDPPCPECGWTTEGTGDAGQDNMILMDHIQDAHMGGSTGPGTPGYTSRSNPAGWGNPTTTTTGSTTERGGRFRDE